VLFAVDLDEDFVDKERVTEALVFTLQALSEIPAEFDTPEAN
jgi:hypothetical protein